MNLDQVTLVKTILVLAVLTFFLRLLPFLAAGWLKENKQIKKTAALLPPAILVILLVYCLKDVSLVRSPYGFPEFASLLLCGLIHCVLRNGLVSIGAGTSLYILLTKI